MKQQLNIHELEAMVQSLLIQSRQTNDWKVRQLSKAMAGHMDAFISDYAKLLSRVALLDKKK